MVDHLNVSYLYKKRGVYYFSKRVPSDVRSYYKNDRIVICLSTKSNATAIRASKSPYQRLDDYWLGLRPQKMDIPAIHLVSPNEISDDSSPNITDALLTKDIKIDWLF